MIFNVSKILVALITITSVSASIILEKRQDGAPPCDFILKPDVPVTTPSPGEFNFVIGRALSIDTGGIIIGSTAFTANPDGTFNVESDIGGEGETAAEIAAIFTSWVGGTLLGISANWLVESVTCIV